MIKYKQISLEEREKIYTLSKNGVPVIKIALELNRHKSTIYREIKRNNSSRVGYLPDRAYNLSKKRKRRNLSKIENNPILKKYIIDKLSIDKWSPEMIAGRMKIEKKEILVSHETIYKYIYGCYGQSFKLYKNLMYARPARQLKYSRKSRYKIPETHHIKNRPEQINSREEFGHFEGDLTFFKGSNSGNISVLLERKTRKTFLYRNNNKTTNTVLLNILSKTKPISNMIKSITFDNGSEFKRFSLLGLRGIDTYFCNPGSPWQKGQVERTNAILHKFISKKSNFYTITDEQIALAEKKLNNLPKKCLNFLTPNEVWDKHNKVALQT